MQIWCLINILFSLLVLKTIIVFVEAVIYFLRTVFICIYFCNNVNTYTYTFDLILSRKHLICMPNCIALTADPTFSHTHTHTHTHTMIGPLYTMPACYWSNYFSIMTFSKHENRKTNPGKDVSGKNGTYGNPSIMYCLFFSTKFF